MIGCAMERGYPLAVVLLFAACARTRAAPAFRPLVAGVWQLKGVQSFDSSRAPEMMRKIGTQGWWRAASEGPGSATVEMYALPAPPARLEMVQQWRPVANTVVWYTPRYFLVVRSKSAERDAVRSMIRELEKASKEAQ